MSAGGDGGEKKKVGRGLLDQYSVSVIHRIPVFGANKEVIGLFQ